MDDLSVYVVARASHDSAAVAKKVAMPVEPAGGWSVLPWEVDDLVALASALNVPDDVVFIDWTA